VTKVGIRDKFTQAKALLLQYFKRTVSVGNLIQQGIFIHRDVFFVFLILAYWRTGVSMALDALGTTSTGKWTRILKLFQYFDSARNQVRSWGIWQFTSASRRFMHYVKGVRRYNNKEHGRIFGGKLRRISKGGMPPFVPSGLVHNKIKAAGLVYRVQF